MKVSDTFQKIKCRQILTSKGHPTVEVDLHTTLGTFRDSCPSGQSTGTKEAFTLLDKEKEYDGKSVHKALFNIKNIIAPRVDQIMDLDAEDIGCIDQWLLSLDGTNRLNRLGVNAVLPVSMCFCRAAAESMNYPLWRFISEESKFNARMPYPCFNVINGGLHAGNDLPFQEMMICFKGASFSSNLEKAVRVYDCLRKVIVERYGRLATNVGDEGGFAPPVNIEDGLDLLMEASKRAGYDDMGIVIDAAASSFYSDGRYELGESMGKREYVEYLLSLIQKYPAIFMIEDPFAEDDYESWAEFKKRTGILVMGDDLLVTNRECVQMAASMSLCNAMLVKPNQVGTVTATIEAIREARKHGWRLCVSHRSTETEDTFVSDLAVGVGAEYVKFGAPCRGERVAKYNQLLRIEEEMKKKMKK